MPITTTYKQLGQRLLTTTGDALIYRVPNANTVTQIKVMVFTNVDASASTYNVYVNQGGTDTGDAFALIKARSLAASAFDMFNLQGDCSIVLTGANANFIVKSSRANALTVTLYGIEIETT